MTDRTIRISYGRTIQSAPYESVRLDVAIEETVDESIIIKDFIDRKTNGLVNYVKNKVKQIIENE